MVLNELSEGERRPAKQPLGVCGEGAGEAEPGGEVDAHGDGDESPRVSLTAHVTYVAQDRRGAVDDWPAEYRRECGCNFKVVEQLGAG